MNSPEAFLVVLPGPVSSEVSDVAFSSQPSWLWPETLSLQASIKPPRTETLTFSFLKQTSCQTVSPLYFERVSSVNPDAKYRCSGERKTTIRSEPKTRWKIPGNRELASVRPGSCKSNSTANRSGCVGVGSSPNGRNHQAA